MNSSFMKRDKDNHEIEMGEMLSLNKIPDGRHYFMLATYNIDPIKLFLENQKKKKNITFPNVAWHGTLANANVAWHPTLAYGFVFFFFLQSYFIYYILLK
jgi:hypothetical protein